MDPLTIAVLLYLGAVLLAFVDLFLPSGGMLAILAVLAATAAILFGFRSSTTAGMSMMALVFFSFPLFVFLAIKIWPHTPIGRRVVLNPPSYQSEDDEQDELVGCVVLTASALMPSGQIRVGHRRLNAISSDGIIEADQRVKILELKERNYIVKQTSDALTKFDDRKEHPLPTDEEAPDAEGSPSDLLDIPASELGIDSIDD